MHLFGNGESVEDVHEVVEDYLFGVGVAVVEDAVLTVFVEVVLG